MDENRRTKFRMQMLLSAHQVSQPARQLGRWVTFWTHSCCQHLKHYRLLLRYMAVRVMVNRWRFRKRLRKLVAVLARICQDVVRSIRRVFPCFLPREASV